MLEVDCPEFAPLARGVPRLTGRPDEPDGQEGTALVLA